MDITPREAENRPPSPVTLRALLVGAVLTSLACVMDLASLMVYNGSYFACDFTLVGAHFLLFVFALFVNQVLRLARQGWALEPRELLTVFVMLAIGCNVSSMGLVGYLLPTPSGLRYYASSENRWSEMIWPYVPEWLMPKDENAIRHFFEGLPTGETIPWSEWVAPMVWWGVFLVGLYSVMIGLTIVFRRQWMEREHLIYPLAQLPVEMMQQGPTGGLSPFFRNRLMWIGFAIPFCIYGWNMLGYVLSQTSGYTLPPITLGKSVWVPRASWRLSFAVSFPVIGLTYLINLPLSFSIWFFSLLQQAEQAILNVVGFRLDVGGYQPYSTAGPILSSQGFGAMIAFLIITVWVARSSLWHLVRRAWKNEKNPDDEEALSPRAALLVILGGSVLMGVWMVRSGLPWVYAPLFVVVVLAIFLALTRIVVECGVPMARSPMIAPIFLINAFGSEAFGPAGISSLGMTCVWAGDVRTFVMCTGAHAWKLSDALRVRARPLLWVMAFAAVLAVFVSCWATLTFGYRLGGCNANSWFFVSGPQYPWRYVDRLLRVPTDPSWGQMGFMGLGAGVVWILSVLHHRFVWWPIHPIGLPIAQAGPTEWFWFSILLGWLFKRVIVWVGGVTLFQKTRPMFLGAVLGNYTSQGFWFVVSVATGVRDLRVPI